MSVRKIYINGKFLSQQESGVQAYAKGLLKTLPKHNVAFEVLVPKSNKLSDEIGIKCIGFFSNLWLWEQISLPFYLAKQRDYILINFCNSAPLFVKNQIVTVHDLAFEQKNVKWFSMWFKLWYQFLIPRLCNNSKCIFTVSEFSKKEISSQYTVSKDKIKVIPNGLSPIEMAERQITGDYLLIVGGNNPRKNASAIIDRISEIESKGLKLVVLSQINHVFDNQKLFIHPSIIYLNSVSKEKYCSLIKYSKALIYPSLYEGFGIPILEALSMKVPVICNELSVFKESFGELPIYFNDNVSFEKTLDRIDLSVISDNDVEKLETKFSFDRSVSLILKSLEELST